MRGARPDATSQTLLPVFATQLKSHKIWNKRRQSRDCSRLNAWHRVHGQNCANIHLFRVSGTETGREGKQWLNVFVSVSQKLIAAYLHSRDHTRSSMLKGGEVKKKKKPRVVIKGSGSVSVSRRYCSIPLSMKGLLWAAALSSRVCGHWPKIILIFCAP